jgi:hypothetical protein
MHAADAAPFHAGTQADQTCASFAPGRHLKRIGMYSCTEGKPCCAVCKCCTVRPSPLPLCHAECELLSALRRAVPICPLGHCSPPRAPPLPPPAQPTPPRRPTQQDIQQDISAIPYISTPCVSTHIQHHRHHHPPPPKPLARPRPPRPTHKPVHPGTLLLDRPGHAHAHDPGPAVVLHHAQPACSSECSSSS